jgi:predicted O-methyltransferase YrrM
VGVDRAKGGGTETETLHFLYGFLRYTQPEVIVEAGTCRGDFTILARHACPSASIYTADIFKHEWIADLDNRAAFFLGDFEKMLQEQLQGIEVDFAFIDSGPPPVLKPPQHEPGVRFRHYSAVLPYMKKGGIVATHDTATDDWRAASTIVHEASIQLNCGRGLSLRQI